MMLNTDVDTAEYLIGPSKVSALGPLFTALSSLPVFAYL